MKDLVDLVLPHMSGNDDRQALLNSALFGCPVLNQINWSGNAYTFTVNMVRTLLTFGECTPGQSAVVLLLETLKQQVGHNQHTQIDSLIHSYSSSHAQGEKRVDALSLTFLLKVGEWAMSELHERWTLRRKQETLKLDTLSAPELEQQETSILTDLVSEHGQMNVQRTLARIESKRDLIEGWKDALVADQKQAQLGSMNLDVQEARKRNFNQQITMTLREIETDLRAVGFTIETST